MNSALLHARRMSLALLVVGVVEHGNASIDCSGTTPNSYGLVRLGRDLIRQTVAKPKQNGAESGRIHVGLAAGGGSRMMRA